MSATRNPSNLEGERLSFPTNAEVTSSGSSNRAISTTLLHGLARSTRGPWRQAIRLRARCQPRYQSRVGKQNEGLLGMA